MAGYPNWGAGIRGLVHDLPGMAERGAKRQFKAHPKRYIGAGLGIAGAGGYSGYRRYRSSARNGLQGRSSGGSTGMY